MTKLRPIPAISASAAALRADGLVVFPTETLYALGTSAGSAEGLRRLRTARKALLGKDLSDVPSTWHAPSVERVLGALVAMPSLHRRLIRKLAPGPVTFLIEASEAEINDACGRIGGIPGAYADNRILAVRIPSDPLAVSVVAEAGVPVVAEAIPVTPGPGGRYAIDPEEALAALGAAGVVVGATVGTEATTLRRGSAVLRLTRGAGGEEAGWRLEEAGPFDEAYVARAASRTILFVCTGNTCRSPMAEAIALGVLRERGERHVKVSSAGVGAMDGAGHSPEAIKAVEGLGLPMAQGRSRMLTPGALAGADEVYVMTRAHRSAVVSMDPSAGPKTRLIDPEGRDVADPIGSGQARYDSVAEALRGFIRKRLEEDPA